MRNVKEYEEDKTNVYIRTGTNQVSNSWNFRAFSNIIMDGIKMRGLSCYRINEILQCENHKQTRQIQELQLQLAYKDLMFNGTLITLLPLTFYLILVVCRLLLKHMILDEKLNKYIAAINAAKEAQLNQED